MAIQEMKQANRLLTKAERAGDDGTGRDGFKFIVESVTEEREEEPLRINAQHIAKLGSVCPRTFVVPDKYLKTKVVHLK